MLNADDEPRGSPQRPHGRRTRPRRRPASPGGPSGSRPTIYRMDASPDGVSLWLVVDTTGGVTVNGSSRLSLQVPGRRGAPRELRPARHPFESLRARHGVLRGDRAAGEPRPDAEPEEPDWPTASGRSAPSDAPRRHRGPARRAGRRLALAEAAGIDDYEVDVLWSHSGPESRYLITVADGETTSIVTLGDNGQPVASSRTAVLDALPGTGRSSSTGSPPSWRHKTWTVIYDQADGHPHGVFGAPTFIDIIPGGPAATSRGTQALRPVLLARSSSDQSRWTSPSTRTTLRPIHRHGHRSLPLNTRAVIVG